MPPILNEAQLYEEYNRLTSFELCIHAQELIQDSINKIAEFVSSFKLASTSSLLGDQNAFNQRKLRIEEIFTTFESFFQRLRTAGTIIHQRKIALDQQDPSILDTNQAQIETLKKEQESLKEELKSKNVYIKLAIDKIAEIIWQINSMQKIKQ
jgi:hypothetical protein